MNKELLPCPCCNGKAKTSDGGFGPVNQDEVFTLHFVECVDCGLMVSADTLDEAIRLWNRRFVRLDKNGDKVFTGDEVAVIASNTDYASTGEARLLACVPINGLPVPLDYVQELGGEEEATVEIELI